MSDEIKTADSAPEGSGVAELNNQNLDPKFASQDDSIEAPASKVALKENIQEAIENGASKAEIKEMIREFEIKVNGKKEKVKLNLNDENEIKKQLQLARAGQSAMSEKAELEKMIQQAMLEGKQDPWKFMEEYFQLNPDEMAEQRIQRKIEEMKKSPEQIEKEQIQKELQDARRKLKEIETKKDEDQRMAAQEKAATDIDQQIKDALSKEPELPKTKKTVRRIADAMLWAMDNGYPDVSVSDVIPSVKAEIKAEFNEFISELPEDLIEAYIGKKTLDKMRKRRVAAAKEVPQIVEAPPVSQKSEEKSKNTPMRSKDYFRNLY